MDGGGWGGRGGVSSCRYLSQRFRSFHPSHYGSSVVFYFGEERLGKFFMLLHLGGDGLWFDGYG